MANIAIILLNWNGKKDTLGCLASLQQISSPPFSTIVVDNGSTDDSTRAIRAEFPHVTLIETGENLGFAEGNNVGIRRALAQGAEYLLLLNNDTVVDPNILTAFMELMEKNPNIGILGGKPYLYDARETLDHLGGKWNPKTATFDLIGYREVEGRKRWDKSLALDYVCGCSIFIRRKIFETIGLLEPKFFLIWEEADFCYAARRAGFEVATCPEAKLWHKVSASFIGGKPHTTYFWWRNRLFWIERNCSRKEKIALYCNVLIPEIWKLCKFSALKRTQLFFTRLFQPKKNQKEKKEKILKYRAALAGIKDYLLRRFGNGPSWIYEAQKDVSKH